MPPNIGYGIASGSDRLGRALIEIIQQRRMAEEAQNEQARFDQQAAWRSEDIARESAAAEQQRTDALNRWVAERTLGAQDRVTDLKTSGFPGARLGPAYGGDPLNPAPGDDLTFRVPTIMSGEYDPNATPEARARAAYDPATDPDVVRERYMQTQGLGRYVAQPDGAYSEEALRAAGVPDNVIPAALGDPTLARQLVASYNAPVTGAAADNPANRIAQMEALAGVDSPQAQIAFITSFQKLIDPGGVVREGDVNLLRSAASLRQQAENSLERLRTGQILTQDQMQGYLEAARAIVNQSQSGGTAGTIEATPEDLSRLSDEDFLNFLQQGPASGS